MKIYNLHIIKTQDTKEISDNTHFYKEEIGHFSTLENVKNAILSQIDEIKKDRELYQNISDILLQTCTK